VRSPDCRSLPSLVFGPYKPLAWVTILNTNKNHMLGYVFKHEEYPWVQNYMSYNTNGWSGRGIEFATQPFDLPHREMVELGKPFKVVITAAMHKLLTILNSMAKSSQLWKENLCPRNA
jgi:hypothetical protein